MRCEPPSVSRCRKAAELTRWVRQPVQTPSHGRADRIRNPGASSGALGFFVPGRVISQSLPRQMAEAEEFELPGHCVDRQTEPPLTASWFPIHAPRFHLGEPEYIDPVSFLVPFHDPVPGGRVSKKVCSSITIYRKVVLSSAMRSRASTRGEGMAPRELAIDCFQGVVYHPVSKPEFCATRLPKRARVSADSRDEALFLCCLRLLRARNRAIYCSPPFEKTGVRRMLREAGPRALVDLGMTGAC